MQLPTAPVKALRKDPRLFLLYGPPKIGKSTILSLLPNNLILDLEQGTEFLECLRLPVKDLAELTQACTMIVNQGKPYRYTTTDTIDVVEEWCEKHATDTYKASTQGKSFTGKSVLNLPNGGGYLWLRQSFKIFINKLAQNSRNVIFVGHIRDKMIESAGKEISAKDLDLTGKIKSIMCSMCDAIGYLNRRGNGNIYITFETKDEIICGSRCDHLKGQTFEFGRDPQSFDWRKIYPDMDSPTGPGVLLDTPITD